MIRALIAATCAVAILVGFTACPHRDQPPAAAAQTAALGYAAEAAAGCETIVRGYTTAPAEVATGAAGFVRATAGKARLPAPVWTVDRIAADPVAYRQAGEKAERVASGTQLAFMLKAGAVALGGIVLALGRSGVLPGPWGMIANAGFALVAPYRDRKSDEAAHGMLDHVNAAMDVPGATAEQRAAVAGLLATLPPKVADALSKARAAAKSAAEPAPPPAPAPT